MLPLAFSIGSALASETQTDHRVQPGGKRESGQGWGLSLRPPSPRVLLPSLGRELTVDHTVTR